MGKETKSKIGAAQAAATKKTSFGPNKARVGPVRRRGGDFLILTAGLGIFMAIAFLIGRHEFAKHQSGPDSAVAEVRSGEQADSARAEVAPIVAAMQEKQKDDIAVSETVPDDSCIGCMSEPVLALPLRPDESRLRFAGLTDVRGRWVARMPDATAEAIFDVNAFQIIYAGKSEGGIRRYVRGYYTYDEATGVMSLKPAYKEKEPDPVPGVVYQVLTLRYFDVIVRADSGASFLYWTAPPEMIASRQIFPLLSFTGVQDNPYLVWEKVR